jgi:nitroreductase
MDFQKLATARYSVRKFQDKPIAAETLNLILEAGRLAPTAGNRQPQRVLVADKADALAKIDLCTKCRFGAPLSLLVCYDASACWVRPFDGENSGQVDASIVTTHMMLQAEALGVGSLWVMFFDPAAAREQFALAETIVPVAILVLGYAAEDAAPSDRHGERQTMDNMLLGAN